MKTELFIINEEGLLEINKPEIREIKEFKEILIRDKGGKVVGDYDGRRKFFAFKEFKYIYLYWNPGSIHRDLPDEVRHKKAIRDSDLPSDWKADKDIKDAGKKYLELLDLSALYHTYLNTNKAVYSMGEDIAFFNKLRDKIRKSIQTKVRQLDSAIIEEEIQPLEAEIDRLTERLMSLGIKITTINDKLPKAFETVEDLKQKLLKEAQGGAAITGGGKLNNREE